MLINHNKNFRKYFLVSVAVAAIRFFYIYLLTPGSIKLNNTIYTVLYCTMCSLLISFNLMYFSPPIPSGKKILVAVIRMIRFFLLICFQVVAFVLEIAILLIFMNGLNEYPQPLSYAIIIVAHLFLTFAVCKFFYFKQKNLRIPSGKNFAVCFFPALIFLITGLIISFATHKSLTLTQTSNNIIRDYNIYFSWFIRDITMSVAIYQMLKNNAETGNSNSVQIR